MNLRVALGTVGAGALLVAAAMAVHSASHPWKLLPEDSVVLFVGECPYSIRTLQNLRRAAAEVQEKIVVVPTTRRSATEICPRTLARLRRQSWALRAAPDDWVCAKLLEQATEFHRAHLGHLPAFSLGMTPVPTEAERAVFATLGILYGHDGQGGGLFRVGRVRRIEAEKEEAHLRLASVTATVF